ncbi:MAG TPA: LuxR C-terminal-related transcriptional regulator [Gaiellaceae bacterium]|nr:LuxR C-terminal-related transcriptional regulator [Gaiellaceae bacterium]
MRTSEIEVVGRDAELAVVHGFLDAVDRLPGVLVIEGEAGIGKTTLWRAGISSARERGFCVLSTLPVQAESQLSYAGLADFLELILEEVLAELPPPQRRALEVALLRRNPRGSAPDQTAIAFAFLGALRVAAGKKPALVAVDDLQWLDAPSTFVLEFAARRLRETAVGLLFAFRAERVGDAPTELGRLLPEERIRRIQVGPLSLGALHHLIQSRLELVLPRPALQRLHQASDGNPFFALELARALKERGDQFSLGEPLPVSGEVRQLLRARLATLPSDSEDALLVVAAVPQPTVGLVAEALGEDPLRSLRRCVEAELIALDGDRIRFIHPLYASAVAAETDRERRRTIHRRLAAIVVDPEERARHLALGARGADAGVASTLGVAARTARARGAPQAAAELSELAFRLTPRSETEAGDRHRLDAGAAYFEAGDTARARALLNEVADHAPSGSLRAEALSRLAWVHHYAGDQRVAVELFRECLADPGADAPVRVDAAAGLASSLFFMREELADALAHARSAVRMAKEVGNRAALAVALGTQGMIEAVLGQTEALPTLQSALAFEKWTDNLPLVRQPSFKLAFARVWGDDLDSARAALESVRQRAVAQGDESSLPFVLTYLSLAEWLSGRWQEAMQAADEGAGIALAAGQDTGRAFALSARALVASCFGREEMARSDAAEALALAERGSMFASLTSSWGLGLLELSLGRPREAHEHLGPLVERVEAARIGEPGSIRFVADDVEALIALGELDTATRQLEHFETLGRRLRRSSALATARRSRGLLIAARGDVARARTALERALAAHVPMWLPFERARTLLALGEVQRRGKQKRSARETLQEALAAFEGLGARLWAEKARAELSRVGGRAPSGGELTPTERRVAELVAEGRSNKEVAAELFVTPKTVDVNLSRIYTKLGVHSRTELARQLAEEHAASKL